MKHLYILTLLLLLTPMLLTPWNTPLTAFNQRGGIAVYQAASTYTAEAPYIVPLAMGSTDIPVGFVKVWNDDEFLYVLFEINLDSYPNYKIYETHLYVSKTQPEWSAPGLWPYSNTYPAFVTSDLYKVPLADIDGGAGVGDTVYLMAHATIYEDAEKTGSAYGSYFKGFFTYTIQEVPVYTPSLSVVKTGPVEAYPGGAYIYVITVSNSGGVKVDNVVVEDTLPSGLTYVSATPTPSEVGNGVIRWNIGTLSVGGYAIISILVRFSPDLTPGTYLTNTVRAWGDGATPVTASFTTKVVAGPSLTVEKVGPSLSYPGSLVRYTIKVTNVGNETAYDVTVRDLIDLNLVEYVSSTPAGVVAGNAVTWSLEALNPKAMVSIELVVRVRSNVPNGTVVLNHAEITWYDGTGQRYGPLTDEFATTVLSNPLLRIAKTGALVALPNEVIRYNITVFNAGGSPAYNVVVLDQLPPGVKFVSATPTPTVEGDILKFSVDELGPGKYLIITISINMSVTVDSGYKDYVNVVSATWYDKEGRSYGPVEDSLVTRVCSRPYIVVGKTGGSAGYIGGRISFTIVVTNTGCSSAYDVVIWDDLPYGIKLVSSNYTWQYDTETRRVIWYIDRLDPGGSTAISVEVEVYAVEYDGVLVLNTVYVNWEDEGGNPHGPAVDFHPVRLYVNPYVEVYKIAPQQSIPGAQLSFVIRLVNPTETPISGVELVDFLPSRVTYLSSTPSGAYDASARTVKWSNLEIGPQEVVELRVVVRTDPTLPNGSIIVNEAVASWSGGSASDTSTTTLVVIRPPITAPIPPQAYIVGGEVVYDYTLLVKLLIALLAVATAITLLVLARKELSR